MSEDLEIARIHADNLEKAQSLTVEMTEKQIAYTNTVVITGFAGYFGLWQISKDFLSPTMSRWSAFLVMLSLVGFVVFELTRMIYVQRLMFQSASNMTANQSIPDPRIIEAHFADMNRKNRIATKRFIVFWYFAIAFTIATATTGAGILVCSFMKSLWTGQPSMNCVAATKSTP